MYFIKARRTAINTFATVLVYIAAGLQAQTALAQTSEPHRDQLLNGLPILLWQRPGDQNVVLKLRIHSGAAFDLAGKAGTMALLGDTLFPDATTHEYFTDEMGGRLEVDTDYDSINITLQGRAGDYDRIVDILRAALTTPLTPQTVAKVREARIKALSSVGQTEVELADRVIAARLFGSFPYGHPLQGDVESLARVERADLLLARERFLNPNNATLVIIGGVDARRAMRALRQLLGIWRKSEQIIPATFRPPDSPDPRTLIVNSAGTRTATIRLATRGLARSDPDYFAADVLARIARARWLKLASELNQNSVFVRHEAHFLPGMFVMGAAVDAGSAAKTLETARGVINSLVSTPITASEFESAKMEALSLMNRQLSTTDTAAYAWLDIDTYSLPPITDQQRAWQALSVDGVQRTAVRLFRNAALASIAVGNADSLKAALAPTQKIEVMGEVAGPKAPQEKPTPDTAPQTKRPTPILPAPKNTNPLMKSTKPPTKPG